MIEVWWHSAFFEPTVAGVTRTCRPDREFANNLATLFRVIGAVFRSQPMDEGQLGLATVWYIEARRLDSCGITSRIDNRSKLTWKSW